MADKKLYKIRHKGTGKYSTGGEYPTFSTGGKIWSARGYKQHLTNLSKACKCSREIYKTDRTIGDYYGNCELVVYDEVGTEDLKKELFVRSL